MSETFTPIRRVVTVKASPEQAFRRFTAELGSWWPLASHSVGQADALSVEIEGRVGGRIVEHIRGGRESVWGTVTLWEPPHRVAFTWHPGDDPARALDVEVRYAAGGDGTRVELEHRGFERLGKDARMARRGYPLGWSYVLGLYARRRGPFMLVVRGLTPLMMAVGLLIERRRAARGSV